MFRSFEWALGQGKENKEAKKVFKTHEVKNGRECFVPESRGWLATLARPKKMGPRRMDFVVVHTMSIDLQAALTWDCVPPIIPGRRIRSQFLLLPEQDAVSVPHVSFDLGPTSESYPIHPFERELVNAFHGSSLARCSSQRHILVAASDSLLFAMEEIRSDIGGLNAACGDVQPTPIFILAGWQELGRYVRFVCCAYISDYVIQVIG